MKKHIYIFLLILISNYFYANEGVLSFIHGDIEIKKSNKDFYEKIKLKDKINIGDIIRTGEKSFVEIKFDNFKIKGLPKTTISYQTASSDRYSFYLEGGYIIIQFKQSEANQKIEITTPTAIIKTNEADFKIYATYNSTTVICVKGILDVASSIKEWQHMLPKKIGTTDKIILTNLINQTQAPILTANNDELFIESETAIQSLKQPESPLQEEDIRLKDFIREQQIMKDIEEKKEIGFSFNSSFGGMQLNYKGYFLVSLRPEFFYKDFKVILNIPFYLDGSNKFYNTSSWGNIYEYDLKSTRDALHDLLLKIEYIGLGKKNSKYFVKIGTIEKFSWANGFIVNNLCNNYAYPLLKKVGLYFETDFDYIGFQGFIYDLNVADIQGYRIFLRPLFKMSTILKNMQIGISGVFDTNPNITNRKNPSIFLIDLDIFIPIFSSEKIKLYFLSDLIISGFRFKDRAIRDTYNLPPNFDDRILGLSFLRGIGYHLTFRFEIDEFLILDTGFIHFTQGMLPEFFDTFYFIKRNLRIEYFVNKDYENFKLGLNTNFKINIKKMISINFNYLFLLSKGIIEYEDKFKLAIGFIPGAIWKLHLMFIYEKINFFKNSIKKIPANSLLGFEFGLVWDESVSVILTAKRYFDEYGANHRIFLLETKLIF